MGWTSELLWDGYWEVELRWSRPKLVTPGQRPELPEAVGERHGVYRFDRMHHNLQQKEVVRIGIAHAQTLAERVHQYTATRVDRWRRRGKIWVSAAELYMNHKHVRNRYEELEWVLIAFMQPRHNEKKKAFAPKNTWFWIDNSGYRGPLPKILVFPAYAYRQNP